MAPSVDGSCARFETLNHEDAKAAKINSDEVPEIHSDDFASLPSLCHQIAQQVEAVLEREPVRREPSVSS